MAERKHGVLKKVLRIAALAIMAVLLIALAYGGYRLYPYVRPAPISDAEADALEASCEAIASEIENRPAADREALEKLMTQWKDKFEAVKERMPKFHGCPMLPQDFGPQTEPFLEEFYKFSDSVGEIVDDGFVLKQRFFNRSEILDFFPIRNWLYWEMGVAYLDAKSGKTQKAMIRINRIKGMAVSLYETPVMLNAMMGVAIEETMNLGVVAIIPHLHEEELKQLADSLQELPDAADLMKKALKTEYIWFIRHLDHMKSESFKDLVGYVKDFGLVSLDYLVTSSYLKIMFRRETKFQLALVRDAFKMIDNGKLTELSPADELAKLGYRSFSGSEGMYYQSLYNRPVRAEEKRKNIIQILRAEAALSAEERMKERTYSYDDERFIYISDKMGCIKKNKERPEQ
jgi:hypothetical protein